MSVLGIFFTLLTATRGRTDTHKNPYKTVHAEIKDSLLLLVLSLFTQGRALSSLTTLRHFSGSLNTINSSPYSPSPESCYSLLK